jgi:hypothetical protein
MRSILDSGVARKKLQGGGAMPLQAFYAVNEKFIIEPEFFKVDEDQVGGLQIFASRKCYFFSSLNYTEILLFPIDSYAKMLLFEKSIKSYKDQN